MVGRAFWRVLMLCGVLIAVAACGGNDSSSKSSVRLPPERSPTPVRTTTGPSATINPTSGRPGQDVVVTGKGWPAGTSITIAGAVPPGSAAPTPYSTVTTAADGTFTARFRLDKSASGGDLQLGPFRIVASSGNAQVTLAYQVLPPVSAGPGG